MYLNEQRFANGLLILFTTLALQFQISPTIKAWGQELTPYRPAVGQEHFDFVLPSIEVGTEIRLSDYRGKKILLFHFASW